MIMTETNRTTETWPKETGSADGPTLDAHSFRWFGRRSRARMAARLAEGLFHLWRNGRVHGHLAARNVAVTREGEPVLHGCGAGANAASLDVAATPFWQNPDLVGPVQDGIQSFWDQPGADGVGTVLGIDSAGAVRAVRQALIRELARA
jgi:hypothetical protein